jgi:tetratricopeptide (TPR) repeat protein
MQRAVAASLLFMIPGAIGCAGHRPQELSSPSTTVQARTQGAPGGAPAWLPAYTPQQIALLTPGDHAITTPAPRVFPDLERFWYANNRRLDEPEDALKFTRMVAAILNDSPRFYVVDAAPGDIANPAVQYGPPAAEPDGWSVARRGPSGASELMPAAGAAEARGEFERGEALAARGDGAGAITAYRAAALKSPKAPAIPLALAAALAKSGKLDDAERAYHVAVAVDPTFAPPYIGLAELAEKRGDVAAARKLTAEALAYQPDSRRGLAVAKRLGAGGLRVAPFAILLDVDSAGAIHVVTAEGTPAQMYGGCRAVMRYEPEVRAQIFEEPRETPYYLSVVEEVICLEAALGAYMVDRRNDDDEPDANLEELLALAHEEGLAGYVMFEILGQHRPERARVAPPDVHRAMVRYVERDLFGQKPAPTGVYTAHLDEPEEEHRLDELKESIKSKVEDAVRRAMKDQDLARDVQRRMRRGFFPPRPTDDDE